MTAWPVSAGLDGMKYGEDEQGGACDQGFE